MAARITQAVVEVVRDAAPRARITQAVVEVVRDAAPRAARVTQVAVEVLRTTEVATDVTYYHAGGAVTAG